MFSSKVTKRLETKRRRRKTRRKKILRVHIEKFKAELLKRKKNRARGTQKKRKKLTTVGKKISFRQNIQIIFGKTISKPPFPVIFVVVVVATDPFLKNEP